MRLCVRDVCAVRACALLYVVDVEIPIETDVCGACRPCAAAVRVRCRYFFAYQTSCHILLSLLSHTPGTLPIIFLHVSSVAHESWNTGLATGRLEGVSAGFESLHGLHATHEIAHDGPDVALALVGPLVVVLAAVVPVYLV